MSVQELYASHPKPWTNVHCYSLTTDNLKVNHVQGANSALLRVPVYSALPPVPDAGHFGYHNSSMYYSDGANWIKTSGNVTNPILSTDNAIARFDGITGEQIQNSGVLINDTNDVSGINDLRTTRFTFDGVNFINRLEPLNIKCLKNTVQVINADTDTIITNYDTVTGTLSASFNSVSGVFTVPTTGYYIIFSSCSYLPLTSNHDIKKLYIVSTNGSYGQSYTTHYPNSGSYTVTPSLVCSDIEYLLAGDTIHIYTYYSGSVSGVPTEDITGAELNIVKVGV